MNLVKVYAPTSGPEKVHFFQQVSAFLSSLDPHKCLVLGGDFNTTLKERDYRGMRRCPDAADVLWATVDRNSLVYISKGSNMTASSFVFIQGFFCETSPS